MDAVTITRWMAEIANSVRAEKDYLVQLDAAIGDGDHGSNMTRGFEAVVEALAAELAQVPLPALAGIKRAADAALPYARPELAGNATADFARAWAAEAHWEAMDRAQQRRRG